MFILKSSIFLLLFVLDLLVEGILRVSVIIIVQDVSEGGRLGHFDLLHLLLLLLYVTGRIRTCQEVQVIVFVVLGLLVPLDLVRLVGKALFLLLDQFALLPEEALDVLADAQVVLGLDLVHHLGVVDEFVLVHFELVVVLHPQVVDAIPQGLHLLHGCARLRV